VAEIRSATGYTRVSGPSQLGDTDGFPRQRAAIERYATAHGLRVARWFEERAVCGATEWEARPAWAEMLAALNGTRTVLIERLDRLARDLMVQEHIIADLKRRGVVLISAAEPDLCTDDPSRKLMRQIMGSIAEYDRAMIALKLNSGRARVKAATGRCGGVYPYGRHPRRPEEVERLEQILQWHKEGLNLVAITGLLEDRGIPSRLGRRWDPKTVSRILRASGGAR